jgi:MFS transporter, DHA3 family, macrolide efflux protein
MEPKNSRRNFLTFCLMFLLSVFGYELIFFIMTLYIFNLTHNAVNVSIFAALTFIPKLLSPLYGMLADRFPKQIVLFSAAVGTTGLMFTLSQVRQMEWIYNLWFVTSILLAMIANIRGSLFAEIFPVQQYNIGNSTMLVLSNAARILAPLLGGTAALLFDMTGLFYTICGVYLLAAVMSGLIQTNSDMAQKPSGKTTRNLVAGFKYIREAGPINYLFKVSFFWRLFMGLQVSLLVIYVKTTLAGNDAQYGYFMTVIGMGSVLGSFAGAWLGKRIPRNMLMTFGLGLHYVTFAALGLVHQYELACVLGFISFAAFYAALVSLHTLRDAGTHSSIRGQVYGTVTALITLPAIVSMLAGGYLAERVGVNWILLAAGVLALVSLLMINRAQIQETQTFSFEKAALE